MKLICYLSNGYPSIEASIEMAKTYVEAGCDIIEIDFPSHNPYLESEYISGRMAKALEACSDFEAYMVGMAKTKKNLPDTTFILMVYENTIEEIGYERFSAFCLENDFRDMILVGIKDDVIKNRLIADGIRVSCYVQYDLKDKEVAYAKQSNGFVYLQAKPAPGQAQARVSGAGRLHPLSAEPGHPKPDLLRCGNPRPRRRRHGQGRRCRCGVRGQYHSQAARRARKTQGENPGIQSRMLRRSRYGRSQCL